MNLKTILAAVVIAVVPLCALAQPKAASKVTNADAQKVVKMISADKAKTQIYCDMAKLGEQIEQADQKKDTKKVEALSKQMDDMSAKLGPEYAALMDGMQDMDANSKVGKDIGATLEGLDALCAK
jgi:starvation-inducible outer membrane lipoprotein